MKRSEKALLAAVAFAGIVYFGDSYGLLDAVGSMVSMSNEELAALQAKNQQYKDSLGNIKSINEEFAKIESVFETGLEGQAQKYRFVDQIVEICRTVNQERPKISPAEYEPLGDVTEYQFVTLEVDMQRMTEEEFKLFMQRIADANIIVMTLDVTNTIDRDSLRVLSKLAKIERIEEGPDHVAP